MKILEENMISEMWINGDKPMIVHTHTHTHVVFAEKMNRPWAILDRCHFDSGCFVFGLRAGES